MHKASDCLTLCQLEFCWLDHSSVQMLCIYDLLCYSSCSSGISVTSCIAAWPETSLSFEQHHIAETLMHRGSCMSFLICVGTKKREVAIRRHNRRLLIKATQDCCYAELCWNSETSCSMPVMQSCICCWVLGLLIPICKCCFLVKDLSNAAVLNHLDQSSQGSPFGVDQMQAFWRALSHQTWNPSLHHNRNIDTQSVDPLTHLYANELSLSVTHVLLYGHDKHYHIPAVNMFDLYSRSIINACHDHLQKHMRHAQSKYTLYTGMATNTNLILYLSLIMMLLAGLSSTTFDLWPLSASTVVPASGNCRNCFKALVAFKDTCACAAAGESQINGNSHAASAYRSSYDVAVQGQLFCARCQLLETAVSMSTPMLLLLTEAPMMTNYRDGSAVLGVIA